MTFTFFPYVQYGDTVKVSYNGGDVQTLHHGMLQYFSDYEVNNIVPFSAVKEHLNDENSGVKVFPNPAHADIQVSWEHAFSKLSIFDTDGKKLIVKVYPAPVNTARLSVNLTPGIYFIKLENKERSGMKKILIK